MTSTITSELLELAAHAARRAGSLLVERHATVGSAAVDTKSSPTDVVTAMDTAAERVIVDTLLAERPGDAVLAEEGGKSSGHTGVRWVIDPLDGTTNYLYGLPEWSVSIAAEVAGEVVVGVVYVAARAEMFTAVRGEGARRNGEVVRCGAEVSLDRALVATGFDYDRDFRAHQAHVVSRVLPEVRDIRRGGCCSADLCSVAAGRVDAFYERARHPWDIAAGALIVTESGGCAGGVQGAAADERLALAAPPGLFERMHDMLVRADPELASPD